MSTRFKRPVRVANAKFDKHNCILDDMFLKEESTKILINELLPGYFEIFRERYGPTIEHGLRNFHVVMETRDKEKLLVVFFCILDQEDGLKEFVSTCTSPLSPERGKIFFPSLRRLTSDLIMKRMGCAEFLKRVFFTLLYDVDWYSKGRSLPLPTSHGNTPPSLHAKEKETQSNSLTGHIHSDPLPRKRTESQTTPRS